MESRLLHSAGLRLIAAWAVASTVGYVVGSALLRPGLPAVASAVQWLAPYLSTEVTIVGDDAAAQIQLNARVHDPIVLGSGYIIPVGQATPARANVIHALVPLVIFFSVLVAVPVDNWRQRVLGLVVGLPFGYALLLLTTPFQLVGLIEASVQQLAAELGLSRPPLLVLRWMLLMEGGGRWALPVAAALVSAVVTRYLERSPRNN